MARKTRRRSSRRPAARARKAVRRRRRGARFLLAGLAALVLATVLPLGVLRFVAPPTTAFMLRSRWNDPATGLPCGGDVAYHWVDGDAISPNLALAVVVAEDQRFLDHHGIDFQGLRHALRERERRGRVRGASTITQQLAKNLFLWPGVGYVRKGVEAWIALWMEALWPKRRILEVYQNVVQFGPCVFGVGAASERYFDHPPAELTPAEAALLATVLPSPRKLRVHDPGPYAQERRDDILQLMAQHAWMRRRL